VIVLGGPNAGKSQFVQTTTRACPEVADYPFTTRKPLPAMMPWEDILVQLIDTPPVTNDLIEPYMQGLVRGADLALLMLDLGSDEGLQQARDVVNRFTGTKTRLGQDTYLDDEDIGTTYTKTLLVPNKIDLADAPLRWELFRDECQFQFEIVLICARTGEGCEWLGESIFRGLDVVRVYTKVPNAKEPDFDRPYTVRRGGTVADIAIQVHKDFADNLRFARIWRGEVHDGANVKSDYEVHDKDIIELHA